MRTAQETAEYLNGKLEGCLKEENNFNRFINLSQLAQNTSSDLDIPNHLKAIWIKKIESIQMGLCDGLIREIEL